MQPYVIRSGDYLAKLAYRFGFDADTVWNDPKNAELRALRPDPNLLFPSDVLYIPDSLENPNMQSLSMGTTNTFVADPPLVTFRTTFVDADGPIKNEPFILYSSTPVQDSTNDQGVAVFTVGVSEGVVAFEFAARNYSCFLHIGDLDPVTTPSGVRQRLRNLGIHPDYEANESVDTVTLTTAIADFQRAQGWTVTGEADDQLLSALESLHGV